MNCNEKVVTHVFPIKVGIIFVCAPPPPPPPRIMGAYYLHHPNAHAIFLGNDLLCNDICSVTGAVGRTGGRGGGQAQTEKSKNCIFLNVPLLCHVKLESRSLHVLLIKRRCSF